MIIKPRGKAIVSVFWLLFLAIATSSTGIVVHGLTTIATSSMFLLPPRRCTSVRNSYYTDNDAVATLMQDLCFTEALEMSLSNMNRLMDDSIRIQKMLHPNYVEVRRSSISGAGMGLFATHQIKSGSLISFYPVHGMGIDGGGSNVAIASLDSIDVDYFHSLEEQEDHVEGHNNDMPSNYRQYLIGNRPMAGYSNISTIPPMFIDVNPNQALVTGWMSHCINDGAIILENTESGVLDYYRTSLEHQNCLQIPFGRLSPLMGTVTTRDIQEDEELFTSYGSAYWLEAIIMMGEEAQTPVTPAIQSRIEQSATELLAGIKGAQKMYVTEWTQLGDFLHNQSY